MLKLVCLINRPRGITHEAFRGWWLGHHAQIAARLPGLRRYTISVAEDMADAPPAYDGVAELWFDDVAAMDAAFASEEGQRCAREDRELIGRRTVLLTEEHVIRDGDTRPAPHAAPPEPRQRAKEPHVVAP